MPRVAEDTYERLVGAAAEREDPVAAPEYRGRRGNPVLFDARVLRRFTALSGDVGGRALFDDLSVTRVPVDDPGVHADIDTTADLDAYRRGGQTRRS